jgi:hypothetical protein
LDSAFFLPNFFGSRRKQTAAVKARRCALGTERAIEWHNGGVAVDDIEELRDRQSPDHVGWSFEGIRT